MSQNKPKWRVLLPREGKMGGVDIYDGDQYVCQMSHHPDERQMAKDYAARIVACVNACEGLPESALKPGIIMAQVIQAQELIAQRDELLAALERLLPWAECMEYAPPGMEFSGDHPIAVARAAIARVKGGAA